MKIRALCAFSGMISMAKGDVCECTDQYVIDDLLQAGYIEAVETPPDTAEEELNAPDTAKEELNAPDGQKKRTRRKKAE